MLIDLLPYLKSKTIVLASQSPRRREILTLLGLPHVVRPSSFAEDLPKSSFPDPAAYATATAHGKAVAVANAFKLDSSKAVDAQPAPDLIIASDTVVVVDGAIVEKPASEADAIRMLRSLGGRAHQVVTAVSLITASGAHRKFASTTRVWFAQLTDDMISAYVQHGEPMDKAGAYGIQGIGGAFVQRIDGCYFTVMGLPMHELSRQIRELIENGYL